MDLILEKITDNYDHLSEFGMSQLSKTHHFPLVIAFENAEIRSRKFELYPYIITYYSRTSWNLVLSIIPRSMNN